MSQPTLSQFTRVPERAEERLLNTDAFGRKYYPIDTGERTFDERDGQQDFTAERWVRLQPDSYPGNQYCWVKYINGEGKYCVDIGLGMNGYFLMLRTQSRIEVDRVHGVVIIQQPPAKLMTSEHDPLGDGIDEEYLEELAKKENAEEAADLRRNED